MPKTAATRTKRARPQEVLTGMLHLNLCSDYHTGRIEIIALASQNEEEYQKCWYWGMLDIALAGRKDHL